MAGPPVSYAQNAGVSIAYQVFGDQVLVSSTVKDLVIGSGLTFTALGHHELKGAPDTWALYRYAGDQPGPLLASGYETDVREPLTAAELAVAGSETGD
ncbi:MAG: hypothetical protein ACR2LQ_06810 [Acidimicrobiales bacterium]